jgi:hypothetical protein
MGYNIERWTREMGVVWADSAGKHGIAREDVVTVVVAPTWKIEDFESSRMPGHRGPVDLYIGRQRDPDAPLLEVLVECIGPRTVLVLHAMELRDRTLKLVEEAEG